MRADDVTAIRTSAPGGRWAGVTEAVSGSVDIAHDGEPQALIASQTTLSGSTGLSFDTLMVEREAW